MQNANQKELKLLGFHAEGYRNIKVVELTTDLLNQRLVKVVGEEGSGKSTLLELVQASIGGIDAIKAKSLLNSGFYTGATLLDGDTKICLGIKSREILRGANKGEEVIETFLYTFDENGKPTEYIADGIAWSNDRFVKEINTDLIFNTKALFSENATEHRKLIEKLFSEELAKLGAAARVLEILECKNQRDLARGACDSTGAFWENFQAEGWNEEDIAALKLVDVEALRTQSTALEVERGSLAKTAESKTELEKEKAQTARTAALQAIKDDARKVVEKIRVMTKKKEDDYSAKKKVWDAAQSEVGAAGIVHSDLMDLLTKADYISREVEYKIIEMSAGCLSDFLHAKTDSINEPKAPALIPISEMGLPEIGESYDKDYEPLVEERAKLLEKYQTLQAEPLVYKTFTADDTTELDEKLTTLATIITKATKTNSVYERYVKWCAWIELKNAYESKVDELRRLYSQIDTGVDGLKLVPVEESGRVNIWMQYSGNYDKNLFKEAYGKSIRLSELSGAQKGVVAVLLQAARLDLKKKALRLVILDAVPMTDLGIGILSRICEEKNIQLITDQTWQKVELEDLDDHTVVVENGELLFRGMVKPIAREDVVVEPKVKAVKATKKTKPQPEDE